MDHQDNHNLLEEAKKEEKPFDYINEAVTIFEHAGGVFRELRELDGITSKDIIRSLRPENNLESIKGAGESQGKSGSFFFFSQDKKFIIKTMNDGELSTFKHMFKDYTQYIKANPQSLLARIYGIFTVYLEDIVPVHLIMMANTIQCISGNSNMDSIDCVFDLKGSLVGRLTKGQAKNTTILKDLNIRFKRSHKLVSFTLHSFFPIVLEI